MQDKLKRIKDYCIKHKYTYEDSLIDYEGIYITYRMDYVENYKWSQLVIPLIQIANLKDNEIDMFLKHITIQLERAIDELK